MVLHKCLWNFVLGLILIFHDRTSFLLKSLEYFLVNTSVLVPVFRSLTAHITFFLSLRVTNRSFGPV